MSKGLKRYRCAAFLWWMSDFQPATRANGHLNCKGYSV